MKNFILLWLLVFLSFITNAQKIKAVTEEDTLDYSSIEMQSLDIYNDSVFNGFEIFDSIVDKSNIFFAGENHEYRASNSKLELKLIKYLYEKAGVRTIIMEFGFSRGWIVDKYINSEDTADLKKILRIYSYKEYSQLYNKLREFNLSLPDTARIHVVGIDVERFNDMPLRVMAMQLPDTAPPDSISLNIEALRGMAGYLDKYLEKKKKSSEYCGSFSFFYFGYNSRMFNSSKTCETFVADFDKHKQYYKEYLGDNFDIYSLIIDELKDQQTYESYDDQPHQYVYREKYLYKKFLKYIKEHPGEKVFGQFGRCHVAMDIQNTGCMWYDFDALAARINKTDNEWLKNKVCSFAYFYSEDETFSDLIKENGHIETLLEKAAEIDTLVAIEINNDSLIFGDFPSWYKFLIYNRKTKEEEVEELYCDYSGNTTGNVAFYLALRRTELNKNNLNSYLNKNNYTTFPKPNNIISFGFQLNSIGDFCLGYNGQVLMKEEVFNYQDTSMVTLSGGTFVVNFGKDVLKSKYFFLKPSVGLGYNFYKMTFAEGKEKVIPDLDKFGGRESQVFYNKSFIVDFSAEAIFKFKFIGIGIKYGYIWDTSKGNWKNEAGEINTESPKFKVSGQYLQAGLYLMFDA